MIRQLHPQPSHVFMLCILLIAGGSVLGASVLAQESPPEDGTGTRPLLGPEGDVVEREVGTVYAPLTNHGIAYLNIAASTIPPRDPGVTYAYAGGGCIYRTGGTGFFNTDVQLPDGVEIVQLRLYYYDLSNAFDASGYLYSYQGDGNFTQIETVFSSGADGYGFVDSAPFSYVVDNQNESLAVVLGATGNDDSQLRLCGVRVSYRSQANLPAVFDSAEP